MSSRSEKVTIVCSEGYRQPERTRAEAEAWIARHAEHRARDSRMCPGEHTIEEKET